MTMDLRSYIRDVPNFPKPGIVFKDITPLLANGAALRWTIDHLRERYQGTVDMVLGIESRGFIIGSALAYALGVGIAIVRKPGKLPAQTFSAQYELEYGNDMLEIHRDAFGHAARVLIVDDLLATGGTASAAIQLTERLGGEIVECAFIIELAFLHGRARIAPHPAYSVLTYEG
jgi:adenine phosphoribosyltransferase